MPQLRALWIRLHRWVALGLGWMLILSGFTGAVLVFAKPLDRWLNPSLFVASGAPAGSATLTLERAQRQLRDEFGAQASITLRPPREPGETFWVLVRGAWRGTVYLDPASGRELGRRGETEGLFNTLFKLHSSLWLQDRGKALLAFGALAYLALLLTGLVLWWPRRWPPSWRIEWRRGLTRALFETHRVMGAALGLLVAVSVATGAYMAWRPLGGVVNALAGIAPAAAPRLPSSPVSSPSAGSATNDLDRMVAVARAQFAHSTVGYVQLPPPDRPLRVRLILPDDPHPNGLTSVWIDPRTAGVLAVQRWNELDPGARAVAVIYPLHTGELGGGWLEPLWVLVGLALGLLGVTGLWMWWRRRRMRQTSVRTEPKTASDALWPP